MIRTRCRSIRSATGMLFEITVQGQTYKVSLNGMEVTVFNFVAGSDAAHPERGLPSTNVMPRFIGLQTHTGRVAFRKYPDQATLEEPCGRTAADDICSHRGHGLARNQTDHVHLPYELMG